MRATLVASRPRTMSVASITNQLAPTLRASASSPLATYVLIETVTPFPVETNVNVRVCDGYCQRNVWDGGDGLIRFSLNILPTLMASASYPLRHYRQSQRWSVVFHL